MSFYSQFAAYYEEIFPFSPAVARFLRRYNPEPNASLDIGCGTGHYAGEFFAQGYQVTGIDLDDAMIDYASIHYPGVIFQRLDMRSIGVLARKYDFAYCIGNTAAHLPLADFTRFVSDLRLILEPGSTWILQLMNWDYVLMHDTVRFPSVTTETNLQFDRTYAHITQERVDFETVLKKGQTKIFEDVTPLYPVTSAKLIDLHSRLGYDLEGHFGSYSCEPFMPEVFSASIFVFKAPS